MKHYTLAFIISLLFILGSCKSEKEKLQDNITSIITEYAKENMVDSSDKLDKLAILSIDTITPKLQCLLRSEINLMKLEYKLDSLRLELKHISVAIESAIDMARIFSNTSSYSSYSYRQYNNYKNEALELKEKAEKLNDYSTFLITNAKRFNDSCQSVDSVTFLDYSVKFLLQTSRNNEITMRDSFSVIVTKDLKIINKYLYLNESIF